MEKKYLRAEEGQPIIDGMIEDAARKLSDLTGSDFSECYDDIADYVNGFDWMLLEEDEEGNDVTYTTTTVTASYEWMSTPDIIRNYKHTYFLSGGMAMHLKLKKGRYKISLYTPVDQQNNFTYAEADAKPFQWESNVFEYNTENPTKVIFVSPTRNDNGFYNGGWIIDYRAPKGRS